MNILGGPRTQDMQIADPWSIVKGLLLLRYGPSYEDKDTTFE